MKPQGKWWQDQPQLHIGQSLALNKITVPETEPVTATPSRGDFGPKALVWTGLKV